jgi:tRNA modification GTPase
VVADRDAIAAIATAPGRGGIGVVRVSGRSLAPIVSGVVGRALTPRHAALRTFRDANGEPIDEGIALYFAAPASYTGEDILELHGHGGPLVLRMLLQRCIELGARVAEPGEFTRRAFLNGRLDLAQAEGVIDLINATTTQAARCAVRSLRGEFSSHIQALASALTELRMIVEASLDFPEEDVEVERHDAQRRLTAIRATLNSILDAARQGNLLREGLHVVIAGEPNVGKSSLLNALTGEDLAIVTDVPGTTRDPIRQIIDLDGVPAHIIDTAGLRDSDDPLERLGIERAWDAIENADAVLLLADVRTRDNVASQGILARLPAAVARIRVFNKIDLLNQRAKTVSDGTATDVWLSAKTGEGVAALKQVLLEKAGWQAHPETAFLARERHLNALRLASRHLEAAAREERAELFAEELRLAHAALGTITGEFTADDLLGEIFSRFCIGK